MRYNKPRRNRFRSNDKGFRKNGSHDLRSGVVNSISNNFQRRHFNRNGPGPKPEKLLEKYNDLAKEALSNGDKTLSESYYQHADHFLRVIENRNSIQNNPKPLLDSSSIEKNSGDKFVLENEHNKNLTSQQQNSEDI